MIAILGEGPGNQCYFRKEVASPSSAFHDALQIYLQGHKVTMLGGRLTSSAGTLKASSTLIAASMAFGDNALRTREAACVKRERVFGPLFELSVGACPGMGCTLLAGFLLCLSPAARSSLGKGHASAVIIAVLNFTVIYSRYSHNVRTIMLKRQEIMAS